MGKRRNAIGDGRDLVRAYGGHIDLGYTFKLPWEPRVFALMPMARETTILLTEDIGNFTEASLTIVISTER